ncbi:hypothetical protein LTR70_002598 [Exophiala xenobiotica]|uniref:FAD dependent oxidoreductase domain-containing protein n=1 Tax=Lithohypha guttulata TaxID=1690604 RepID=A0ABR0KK33_9EURO|nr:hypothetical protein LTR24_002225 [Lithohypha guttulata]KAK5325218.1 hypothetical protein LTR70_002598 [Exophiala xenobiotica]
MAPSSEQKNIVIVGAGIIGSTTAYFLTRHPSYDPSKHKITLLEATSVASAASGKAGGLLALWAYPKSIVPLSFRLHQELAEEHGGKERWGYRPVGVGAIEIEGRRVPKGSIRAAVNDQDAKGKKEPVGTTHSGDVDPVGDDSGYEKNDVSLEKELGVDRKQLMKMGLPEDLDWVAGESVKGYQSMAGEGQTAQVHPFQFTTSMARLAEEKGVSVVIGKCEKVLVEGGQVRGVQYKEKESGQEKTIDGVTDVIVTAGPWSKKVWPGAPIGNLRAHSVCIRPSRPVSAYCLFTDIDLPKNFKEGVKSRAMNVTPEIYARPNNELYACGEGDHMVPLPETSADVEVDDARCQDIVDYCASFSDEMRDGEVLVRQACYLPQAEYGGGPLVGPTRTKGVWLAAGHTCWGIQNGPGTGKLMSEYIFDGEATSANVSGLDPRKTTRR